MQWCVGFCHKQHESTIDIHMSPPSWTSLPSQTLSHLSRLSQSNFLFILACFHRIYLLYLWSVFILKWSRVDQQCCDSFSCTAKSFSCPYPCVYLFKILFPFRLLHRIAQNSLFYIVGLCWLSILNTAVCPCYFQTPNLSIPQPFPLVTISSLCKSVSLFSVVYNSQDVEAT